MGLFDWLSEAIGDVGNAASNPMTMGGMSSAGTPPVAPPQPPMPPVQQTGADQPPMPPLGAMSQGGPMGPDSPQNPTGGAVPMPMPKPPGANAAPPTPPAPPMNIAPPTPPSGGMLPPGASSTEGMMPPGGMGAPGGQPPQARGILSRALGLDPNQERRLTGSLGAGLRAAGNSSGKSPFQAFASGAGASLEGGEKADDTVDDKQRKYLTQAIDAQKAGDQRGLNLARTKLAEAQTQMTLQGKMGKDSVVNSDQQLYLRAQGATNQDANLKILKSQYDAIVRDRGAGAPEARAAMDAYQKAYTDTLNGHLGRLGLDPKTADKIGKQPGMAQENPIPKTQLTSQEAFDKLPPGSWFVNPKDGKVLQKPMQPVAPGGAAPQAAPSGQNLPAGQGGVPASTGPNLPPLPPSAPTKPVAASGFGGEAETDDDKEAA